MVNYLHIINTYTIISFYFLLPATALLSSSLRRSVYRSAPCSAIESQFTQSEEKGRTLQVSVRLSAFDNFTFLLHLAVVAVLL